MYILTVNNSRREYATLKQAQKIADRTISFFSTLQKKYDRNIQVLNYISIDSDVEYDVFYFDGSKLK